MKQTANKALPPRQVRVPSVLALGKAITQRSEREGEPLTGQVGRATAELAEALKMDKLDAALRVCALVQGIEHNSRRLVRLWRSGALRFTFERNGQSYAVDGAPQDRPPNLPSHPMVRFAVRG